MNLIKKGSTDVTRYVKLVDSAAGTPETGYTITSLDLQYTRNRTAPAAKVDATALAATDSAHGDNQAIQVDATSSPGLYRVDWPDAAFATGADKVILCVSGTGLDPCFEEIQLVDFDPNDTVRLGLTALPNAAADAAGGLIISDAGGLDADAQLVTKINSILDDTGTAGVVVASINAGAVTAAAIANGAIDAATFAADVDAEILSYLVDDATRIDASALNTLSGHDPGEIIAGATDLMTANVTQISGDSTAADNLEAVLDGTGGVTLVASAFTLTTPITANATQLSGDATAADNAEAFFDGTGYAGTGNVIPTVTLVTTVTNLTNAPTAGDLTATMKTSVNTEVLDVLNVDTFAEPGQEAPPATTTLVKKIGYIFKFLRNKVTQSATEQKVFADDGTTVDQKSTLSDDGTTFTRGEFGTGP